MNLLYHRKKDIPFIKAKKSEYSRKSYLKSKDRVLYLQKLRREKNPELIRERVRISQQKRRAYMKRVGISERNNDKYGGNLFKVLERDGYKCQDCGLTEKDHIKKYNMRIPVHHIDGTGSSKMKKDKNNKMSNLITLCCECHTREENRIRSGLKPRSIESFRAF